MAIGFDQLVFMLLLLVIAIATKVFIGELLMSRYACNIQARVHANKAAAAVDQERRLPTAVTFPVARAKAASLHCPGPKRPVTFVDQLPQVSSPSHQPEYLFMRQNTQLRIYALH